MQIWFASYPVLVAARFVATSSKKFHSDFNYCSSLLEEIAGKYLNKSRTK